MLKVSGSTSAKTGMAFWASTTLPLQTTVSGEVITSSPAPTPTASSAAWRVEVPELKVMA